MNLTTNQITQQARKKLLETGGEVITDATILLYANLTQDDIDKRAFPNTSIKTATVTFTAGSGTLPTDFGTLYGDAYDATGMIFYPEQTIEDFTKQTLEQAVCVEDGTLKVHPTTVSTLQIKYYKTNPTMTSVVNPSINGYFHELIIYGILYRAFEDLQDEQLASFYREKYEKDLTQKISVMSNYEEGNQRSSEMFSYQQLI